MNAHKFMMKTNLHKIKIAETPKKHPNLNEEPIFGANYQLLFFFKSGNRFNIFKTNSLATQLKSETFGLKRSKLDR